MHDNVELCILHSGICRWIVLVGLSGLTELGFDYSLLSPLKHIYSVSNVAKQRI